MVRQQALYLWFLWNVLMHVYIHWVCGISNCVQECCLIDAYVFLILICLFMYGYDLSNSPRHMHFPETPWIGRPKTLLCQKKMSRCSTVTFKEISHMHLCMPLRVILERTKSIYSYEGSILDVEKVLTVLFYFFWNCWHPKNPWYATSQILYCSRNVEGAADAY